MRIKNFEIAVGVFMAMGLLAILMLALQVSGLGDFYNHSPGYKVKFEFTNIGSLKVRSKVAVAGVVIGRVANIKLDPTTYNAMVTVKITDGRQIPEDSRASILTAGLLGDNYIGVTPGFSDAF